MATSNRLVRVDTHHDHCQSQARPKRKLKVSACEFSIKMIISESPSASPVRCRRLSNCGWLESASIPLAGLCPPSPTMTRRRLARQAASADSLLDYDTSAGALHWHPGFIRVSHRSPTAPRYVPVPWVSRGREEKHRAHGLQWAVGRPIMRTDSEPGRKRPGPMSGRRRQSKGPRASAGVGAAGAHLPARRSTFVPPPHGL